jgi:putative FmdB family regulatory protein
MPSYEYLCKKCGKKFTVVMTIGEHDRKKVRCPKCASVRVEQQYFSFFAVTSKKS